MPGPRGSVLAGLAFALALSTSSAAMAECTGTGQLSSITSFLPFSAGGAVSSLVSAINTTNTAFLTQGTAFRQRASQSSAKSGGRRRLDPRRRGDVTTKNTKHHIQRFCLWPCSAGNHHL